ncbi:MAG: RNA methyltransferase [Synechococcus sp.]|nr:RNA methyltransferase [Synechococcus sp.]
MALVQEYLKVDLIFNLQVLQDEASGLAQLTLSLVEGRRKTVRSVQCPKCGLEQLLACELYPSLEDAVADCRRVVACSGRVEAKEREHLLPQPALQWLLEPKPGPNHVALVFGREDHGLHSSELNLAGKLLRIPTSEAYGSLNLSHAVAICLAEHQRLAHVPMDSASDSSPPLPAHAALEAAMQDAEELLLEVGFLYPHTAAARMAKLRQLMLRSEPSEAEVALLRGMVRQLRWASRHGATGEPR